MISRSSLGVRSEFDIRFFSFTCHHLLGLKYKKIHAEQLSLSMDFSFLLF
nr:MAG TPA: hypothetical protein [Caudoviricetes sp.]